MKRHLIPFVSIFVVIGLSAEIGSFRSFGTGRFSGKLGMFAMGDTLGIAFRTANPNSDLLNYLRSTDGGQSWNEIQVTPQNLRYPGVPTLSYSPGELIIGTSEKVFRSSDGGISWDGGAKLNASFENSPYIEKVNGQYHAFTKSMYYTEDMQRLLVRDNDELPLPQWISGTEEDIHGFGIPFTAGDVMSGPVIVHDDLYLGAANDLPEFNKPVIISGEVNANFPEGVFNFGLSEHAPLPPMPQTEVIRQNAQLVGPPDYSPNRIVYIEVDGTCYQGWMGTIMPAHQETSEVWPTYPDGTNVPPQLTNTYSICDTIWTPLPAGVCGNRTMFVNSKLWISGKRYPGNVIRPFDLKQTWCAADTIFIVGDILIRNTAPPSSPDNNLRSMVCLISEKSILLKYGFFSPVDSVRIHPLLGDSYNPRNIYATLIALGDGEGSNREDGMFTFEYQHPHPSIPAVRIDVPDQGSTLFEDIDLHRQCYPQTASDPWPPQRDLPWYNPLWPERQPYLERGRINLWGSIIQTRRGYLHRPYEDANWPSNGIWNPAQDFYGGSSAPEAETVTLFSNPPISITLQNRNYADNAGNGVGYVSHFKGDNRLTFSSHFGGTPFEAFWNVGLSLGNLIFTGESANISQTYLKPYLKASYSKCIARNGDMALYGMDDLLVMKTGETVTDLSSAIEDSIKICSVALDDLQQPWSYQYLDDDNERSMMIKKISPATGEVVQNIIWQVGTKANDITALSDGRIIAAKMNNTGLLEVWDLSGAEPLLKESWSLNLNTGEAMPINDECRLYLVSNCVSGVEVILYQPLDHPQYAKDTWGTLYYAHADVSVGNDDPVVPATPIISFDAYPNPTNDELRLEIKGAEQHSASIEVYNLKGQKVVVYNLQRGAKHVTWKGTDSYNNKVGSGVYIIKLVVDGKAISSRRVCRIE